MAPPAFLVGKTFGKLTVISQTERPAGYKTQGKWWLCRCECGKEIPVQTGQLNFGRVTQCKWCRSHRHTVGGETKTYRTWRSMRERCGNPNSVAYQRYGGSGITVCERWGKLENFIEDMGLRPEGMTLDRIDGTKGYEPSNCRWATRVQQARNQSNNKLDEGKVRQIKRLIVQGRSEPAIAREFGISHGYVNNLKKGKAWSDIDVSGDDVVIDPDARRLQRLMDYRASLDLRIEKLIKKMNGS